MSDAYGEQAYYEDATLWRQDRFVGNERELRRFTACVELLPAGLASLLDVGAGNGAFLAFLEQRGEKLRLAGVERSEVAIELSLCRTRIEPGSVDRLGFEDGAFDCVSAMEVLEHLPFGVFEEAVNEISRVAREYILVSVPYRERRRKVICPYCDCGFNANFHMRSFDEKSLAHLFPGYRMTRTTIVPVREHLLAPAVMQVQRWAGRRRPAPTALCPQCGYRGASGSAPGVPAVPGAPPAAGRVARVWKRVRPLLPKMLLSKRERPNWIVALYRRE